MSKVAIKRVNIRAEAHTTYLLANRVSLNPGDQLMLIHSKEIDDCLLSLIFCNNGEVLIGSGMGDPIITIWEDFYSKPTVIRLATSYIDPKARVALHPDGQTFAVVSENLLQLWNWKTKEMIWEQKPPIGGPTTVAFSPDGQYLFAGGGKVYVYAIEGSVLTLTHTYDGDWADVEASSIVFHPDRKTIATNFHGDVGTLILFNKLNDFESRVEMELTSNYIKPAAFDGTGSYYAFAETFVNVYYFPQNELLLTFGKHGQVVKFTGKRPTHPLWSNCLFLPNSLTLVCGSPEGVIYFWDIKIEKVINQIQAHSGRIIVIALSEDGTLLASSGVDKTLKVWRL